MRYALSFPHMPLIYAGLALVVILAIVFISR